MLSKPEPIGEVAHPLDVGILTNLANLVADATRRLDAEYDYAWVLQRTESFFWDFCDNYLELIKARRYGDFGGAAAGSANTTMLAILSVLNRLFAPFIPFVAEEIWSWWRPGSVHRSHWPVEADVLSLIESGNETAFGLYVRTTEVLAAIRKRKSEQRLSAGAPLQIVRVRNNEDLELRLAPSLDDLKAAARTDAIQFMADPAFDVEIVPKESAA